MKITPYIDPEGIPRERERAAYRPVLITEGDRLLIGFLPQGGDGLTCLEFVRVFSFALRPEADQEKAPDVGSWLVENLEGLDAVYDPERDPKPTFPNVMLLRAA